MENISSCKRAEALAENLRRFYVAGLGTLAGTRLLDM
jgi:hypothetical protein